MKTNKELVTSEVASFLIDMAYEVTLVGLLFIEYKIAL